jgi:DNA excision repair protein ERCC-3
MSRSPSPASSLDYFQSSGSASEDDYQPRRRAPVKRKTASAKKGPTIRINLSALARARDVAAAHPIEGDVEEDEYGVNDEEAGYLVGLLGRKGVDLSGQELKGDHAARPLWVDEYGNMYGYVLQIVNRAECVAFSRRSRRLRNKRKSFSLPSPSLSLGESAL